MTEELTDKERIKRLENANTDLQGRLDRIGQAVNRLSGEMGAAVSDLEKRVKALEDRLPPPPKED
ncbi:MAG: hypothetical protein J0M36_07110 [Caulobacterales bacterium]|nr:hypothetical protein [Caulobacterales bacterium]